MSKINLLLIVLFISIGINIYEYMNLKKCTSECERMHEKEKINAESKLGDLFCDNNGRIKPDIEKIGGTEIDDSVAEGYVINYQKAHEKDPTKYNRTGFIFSKQVFDHIFNNSNMSINSVRLDLITDSKDSLFIVAKGVKRKFMEVNYSNKPSRVFINQSMCPKDCVYQIWQ